MREPPGQQDESGLVGLEYQETNVRGTAKEGCGVVVSPGQGEGQQDKGTEA